MATVLKPLSTEQEKELIKGMAYKIVRRWKSLTMEQQISLVNQAAATPLTTSWWNNKAIIIELWERLTDLRSKLRRQKRNRNQKGHVVLQFVGGATAKNPLQPSTDYILDQRARLVRPHTHYAPAIENTEWRQREKQATGDLVHSILEVVDLVSPEDRAILDRFLGVVTPRDTVNSVAKKLGMDRTELSRVLQRARKLAEVKVFAKRAHAVAATLPIIVGRRSASRPQVLETSRTKLQPELMSSDKAWKAAGAPIFSDIQCGKLVEIRFPQYSRDSYEKLLKEMPDISSGQFVDLMINAECEETLVPTIELERLRAQRQLTLGRWDAHKRLGRCEESCPQCSSEMAEIGSLDREIEAAEAQVDRER